MTLTSPHQTRRVSSGTAPWWKIGTVLVLCLGFLAIGSLYLLDRIEDDERQIHALSDNLWAIRLELSAFHTQLDERLAGPPLKESGDVWSPLVQVRRKMKMMLLGGTSTYGLTMQPVRDATLRQQAAGLLSLLNDLDSDASGLEARLNEGTVIALKDERFHETYARLMSRTRLMEDSIHLLLEKLYVRSRIYLKGMLAAWGIIVLLSASGLWRFGRLHREAERERTRLASYPALNPNPIVEVDLEGNVHYLNQAARKIFGPEGPGSEHTFLDDIAAKGKEAEQAPRGFIVREVLIGKEWFEQTLHYVPDAKRLRIYAHNISEAKRSHQDLLVSEQRYRQLFTLAQEGIWVIDAEAKTTLVNASMAAMLGYTEEEMVGQEVYSFMDERGKQAADHQLARLKQGISEQFDFELIRKDGTRLFIAVAAAPIMDGADNYVGTIAGAIDISERRRAQDVQQKAFREMESRVAERTAELSATNEKLTREIVQHEKSEALLRQSKNQYRTLYGEFNALLDAIQEPLLLLSPEMKILWGNRAAAAGIVGDRSELSRFHCYDLLHARSTPCDACPAGKAIESERAEGTQVITAEGRSLELRAYPVKDDDRQVVNAILTVHDITEASALQAEAIRTAHLASLGEMAAGVAHEINNPINGIINYSQLLANLATQGSDERDLAERIIKEGDRVAAIVRSLLSFAKDRKEGKEIVQVVDVLSESVALVNATFRKDTIELTVDAGSPLPPVLANPQQLQQVFLNILNNGRYALNIKYPTLHPDKRMQISVGTHLAADIMYLRLSFLDFGTGIPSTVIKAVLDPFFSTKPRGEGTGLGLSISHGIISDHGGRMMIESVEGEFTRVIVELPVEQPAETA